MEKIKAALHIHDKTEVPGDGAVGNMQNPSSSDEGPTSEELWGSGNADTKHHHSHKGDTLAAAAAAAGTPKNYSQPAPTAHPRDDPFGAAHQAQQQLPPSSSVRGDENAILAAELSKGQALPQEEKTLSPIDDPKVVKSIDPFRHEPEPSEETGPGTHFTRPETASSTAPGTDTSQVLAGHGKAEVGSVEHTAFYDKATGREGHQLGK